MEQNAGRRIGAVGNVFDIVDHLLEHDEATLAELADTLGLAKSTTHAYVETMRERDFIRKRGNKYALTFRFFEVGEIIRQRIGIIDLVREALGDVVTEMGGISWFIVEEDGYAVFVEKATGADAVQPYGRIGKRTTLHDIAAGKAILAHLPDDRVEEIVSERGLPAKTENTVTGRDELVEELTEVRERGYAVNDGENVEGWRAVASPVLHEGRVRGAIAASGPKHRMRGERFTETAPDVVTNASNQLQLQLRAP